MVNSHHLTNKATQDPVKTLKHFAVASLIPLSCKVM